MTPDASWECRLQSCSKCSHLEQMRSAERTLILSLVSWALLLGMSFPVDPVSHKASATQPLLSLHHSDSSLERDVLSSSEH